MADSKITDLTALTETATPLSDTITLDNIHERI